MTTSTESKGTAVRRRYVFWCWPLTCCAGDGRQYRGVTVSGFIAPLAHSLFERDSTGAFCARDLVCQPS